MLDAITDICVPIHELVPSFHCNLLLGQMGVLLYSIYWFEIQKLVGVSPMPDCLECFNFCSIFLMNKDWFQWQNKASAQMQRCSRSRPTLCDPMDCISPGPSVHEIFQARILQWVAISFSKKSSHHRNWTWVSLIAGGFFSNWTTWGAPKESIVRI